MAPECRTTAYARAAVAGEIVVGKLVRLACERHLRDLETAHERGLRWNQAAADRVLDFFPMLEHRKGEKAGQGIELELWQCFVIGSVFGWQRWDEASQRWIRRFRIAYVEIARKNGKSTIAAGVGNYLAFFDAESGAEVYAAATKRDQAKIVWSEAKWQIQRLQRKSKAAKRIAILANNLNDESTASKFEPLGADSDSTDGLNCHANIVDELHAHKTRELWDVLEEAMAARLQPLHFAITTAGHDRASVCWEQREYAIKILEGVIPARDADSYFAYIATLDDADDWADESCWVKANPNLGVSVKLEYLRDKVARALETPGVQNSTRQKHFNVWTEGAKRWFDVARVAACYDPDVTDDDLAGERCFGGLDLAGTADLNAYAQVFPDGEGGYDVRAHFWMPEGNLAKRVREDRVPYDVWAEAGWITLTDGNTRDDQAILDGIRELKAPYDVAELGVDPWQMNYIATQLISDGVEVVKVPQTFASLAMASEELEKSIAAGKLRHDGNPVLVWCFSNVVADEDPSGNKKPSKKLSRERIDGVSAVVTAMARTIVDPGESGGSVYDERDVRRVG